MQTQYIKALSIKRLYAERIISGEKTIELRKRPIGLTLGDLVLLYETFPDAVIRAGFIADKTVALSVPKMWRDYSSIMGVEKQFYDSYFENCEIAYGTLIHQSFCFRELPLNELRQRCPGFIPPQATINWRESWYVQSEWTQALSNERKKLMESGILAQQLSLL
ncbi:MAG: hypothetical protein DCF25_18175 [Leptolyngbya foveolarum]|uniref:ASCH domain-containing protein n=1 Tax=Leptolyngbya foveolarum TaxID=47253 RepID=A0A2W4TZF1_9CYAN|nr:MAG: hypothetical protein DCF25_18175 [Leptolyngbya foveolarum]